MHSIMRFCDKPFILPSLPSHFYLPTSLLKSQIFLTLFSLKSTIPFSPGFSIVQNKAMDNGKKKYKKWGFISRFEPSSMSEINASPFIKKYFEEAGCLSFCQKVQEVDYHQGLTSQFSISLKK